MNRWKTKTGYEVIQVLAGRSNVFVLTNGEKNLLVDTSVSRLRKILQRRLDSLGVETIDYLVLTHAHYDHAANARHIQKKYKAKVIVQRADEPWLSAGDNMLPAGTNLITRTIVNLLGKWLFHLFRYEPCRPDLVVDSQADLKSFGENVYLIHSPGHTPGSMSIIVDDELALVGDTLFGVFRWTVFPPYARDPETMIRSWRKLLQTNCSLFLPSHGTSIQRTLLKKDFEQRIKVMIENVVIRPVNPSQQPFLEEMLYEAIFVPDGVKKPPRDIIKNPDLYRYIHHFGREGDHGLVAEINGCPVGAIWTRLFSMNEKGYGFVDEKTPELSMAVSEPFRHQGIGRLLLKSMISHLTEHRYRQVSLSVDRQNYAYDFYLKQGFEIYESTDKSAVMIYCLNSGKNEYIGVSKTAF